MFHIHYNCLQCGKLFRTKNSLDKHISCYHVNFYKTVRKEKRKRNRVEYIQEQIDKKEKEKEKENEKEKEKEKENEDGGETEFIEEGEINTSNNFINSRGLEDIIHHNKDNQLPTQNNIKNEQPLPNFDRFINEFDEMWIEFYILYLESKISSAQAEKILHFIEKFFYPKGGKRLPKTMRTLKKKINQLINIQHPKDINLISKKYIEKSGKLILLEDKIQTKYFSPITWINMVVHSDIIKHLSFKKNEEIENLVTNEGFFPFAFFQVFRRLMKKINKIPKIDPDLLFLIGFLL
ncbi:c2h2 type zinc finger transcription factor family-related [Anaeramoeba flamelloides]|uniref:C2h2 type zinc finger transcription factor family-related n=1 Tax=Anaeramoeba flamelloides TaxID=1746091 RepID=A0AAV7ZBB5_9EUKA|nr:c2h2 type zinc finger transcription factor family-related [Anaeramoeba flamelloides]